MSEVTVAWSKLLLHPSGREKSVIEVTSREVCPDGHQSTPRKELWVESKNQIHPIITGMIFRSVACMSEHNPTRNYHVMQFDHPDSPDMPYNLPVNNPNKQDPKAAMTALASFLGIRRR